MRKIFSYFPILIAGLLSTATLLSACGDDNDDPAQPSVTLPAGASTDITFASTDAMVPSAICFVATGDWSADILPASEAAADKDVSWLVITPYRGVAGNKQLTAVMSPNLSKKSRSAIVKINSVSNAILFNITQLGSPAGGGEDPTPGTPAAPESSKNQ